MDLVIQSQEVVLYGVRSLFHLAQYCIHCLGEALQGLSQYYLEIQGIEPKSF